MGIACSTIPASLSALPKGKRKQKSPVSDYLEREKVSKKERKKATKRMRERGKKKRLTKGDLGGSLSYRIKNKRNAEKKKRMVLPMSPAMYKKEGQKENIPCVNRNRGKEERWKKDLVSGKVTKRRRKKRQAVTNGRQKGEEKKGAPSQLKGKQNSPKEPQKRGENADHKPAGTEAKGKKKREGKREIIRTCAKGGGKGTNRGLLIFGPFLRFQIVRYKRREGGTAEKSLQGKKKK